MDSLVRCRHHRHQDACGDKGLTVCSSDGVSGSLFGRSRGEVSAALLRREVDSLLERRLEDLSPQDVKRIIEDVIRKHLGWLVVWGNVFGGLIGLGAYLLRDLLP